MILNNFKHLNKRDFEKNDFVGNVSDLNNIYKKETWQCSFSLSIFFNGKIDIILYSDIKMQRCKLFKVTK